MAVFWDVAPCSLIKFTAVSEAVAASITTRLDDADSKHL
jgi:hypothetical protein